MLKLLITNTDLEIRTIAKALILDGTERVTVSPKSLRITSSSKNGSSYAEVRKHGNRMEIEFTTSRGELEDISTIYYNLLNYFKSLAYDGGENPSSKENILLLKANNVGLAALLI